MADSPASCQSHYTLKVSINSNTNNHNDNSNDNIYFASSGEMNTCMLHNMYKTHQSIRIFFSNNCS